LAATPVFALWNPLGLFLAMVVFALTANVPCLVVLRYNRARLVRRTGQARAA
jgi:glycosyl-4,4'-diaponeurosporenoate acyltransferase